MILFQTQSKPLMRYIRITIIVIMYLLAHQVKNLSGLKDDIKIMLLALLLPPSSKVHDHRQKSNFSSGRDWL